MKTNTNDTIPPQKEGNELNVSESVTTDSKDSAQELFMAASQRLLNVSEWHTVTQPPLAVFQLTNKKGEGIRGEAHEGDYFRIDVPGPASSAGDGFDWVRVEKIVDETTDTPIQSLAIRVRPVANPLHPNDETAHFFDDKATSTFKVYREGLTVTAAVYGRNELPNTDSKTLADKVRNTAMATGAFLGAAHLQWERLVKGLLGNPPEKSTSTLDIKH